METVCIREMAGAWLLRITVAGTPLHVNFSFSDRTLVLFLISDLNFDPTTLSFAHPCSPPRSLEPYQPPDPPTQPSGHLNRMESGSRLYQEVLMKPVVNPKRFAHALRS